VTRKYLTVKAGQLVRTANHIRESLGTEEELRQLGRSYLARPLQPIICRPAASGSESGPLEVLDGNRRLEGVLLEGGPDAEVPVCTTDEPMSDAVKLEIMMESAIHTRALSDFEEYQGASQWLAMNPGATADQLAKRIGRTPSMLMRILSLGRCIPAVQEQAKAGLLNAGGWYEFAKCCEQDQHEMLAARTSGAARTRDDLARMGRQKRTAPARLQPGKQARVRHPIGAGVVISVQGKELSLPGYIDALSTALEAAKRAQRESLDVKTAMKVWADKAKVGANREQCIPSA
jgi:ParB-like chromosome segregation protein Spo0J